MGLQEKTGNLNKNHKVISTYGHVTKWNANVCCKNKNLPVFTERFLRTDTYIDAGILARRNTKTQEGFLLINYYSVTSFRSEISGEAIRE